VINYFDWSGTRDALTRWVEAVRSECEKNNVGFMGLYGPSQVRFNWCFIHEVDTQERYHRTERPHHACGGDPPSHPLLLA